ncbi:MAG TPA: hypothetical protein VLM39_04340 [Ignavibacteriaceae bacterium]|nr:hypothetical protein [Ignavibacteriaceae bacterium]
MKRFGRYKSKVSISQYAGKLYIDPVYGIEQPLMKINYAVFSSRWDIEELPEDYILKIIHRDSGDSIHLAFNSLKDRINFTKLIYASRAVKQVGKGMNLEDYANLHVKPKKEGLIEKIFPGMKEN